MDTVQGEDELDKAYKEIVKKTDIHPLKLVYIPAGMKFIKIDIGEKWAVIYFDYAQYKIKFFQRIGDVGNSANVVSDRKKKESIYNDFLKQKIYIDEAKTDNGKVEYSSYIVKGDMYYQLSGIMPKKEFKKIVENLILED